MSSGTEQLPYGSDDGRGEGPAEERLLSPSYYFNVLRKRLWLVLSLAAVGAVAGLLIVATTEPVYEAKAQILYSVGPPKSRGEVVEKDYAGIGLATIWEQDAYLATQTQLLKGRGLATAVLERLDPKCRAECLAGAPSLLTRVKAFLSRKPDSTKGNVERAAVDPASLVDAFASRVSVERVGPGRVKDSRILSVSFEGRDRQAIVKILDAMLAVYKERDTERRYRAVTEVLNWLREKQKEVQSAAQAAETKVQEYIEKERIAVIPGQFEGETPSVDEGKLDSLSTEVVTAHSKRVQAETMCRNLEQLLKEDRPFPSEARNAAIDELSKRLAELEAKRAVLAERFGDKWPEIQKIDLEMTALRKQIAQERKRVFDAATASFELAKQQEDSLKKAAMEQKQETIQLRRKGVVYRMLRREASANEQLYELLIENAKEANIAQSIDRSQITIETPAYISGEKAMERARKKAFAIVFMFLAGGLGLAVLIERFNPIIEAEGDVSSSFDIPVWGSVTKVETNTNNPDDESLALPVYFRDDPKSLHVEQIQRITANALAHVHIHGANVLLITSMYPQEGKSFIAANLGAGLARCGKRILLVDADMRQPTQHRAFRISNEAGLADVLSNGIGADSALLHSALPGHVLGPSFRKWTSATSVVRETEAPGLFLMTAGKREMREQSLPFQSDIVGSMLHHLRTEFDMILVDAAPVGVVSDALTLSRAVDGIVFVVGSRGITKSVVRGALQEFERTDTSVAGIVLNHVRPGRQGARYYYYYHRHPYYSSYYANEDDQDEEDNDSVGEEMGR